MKTECRTSEFEFHALGSRDVVGRFDGGNITSDAGGALLREVEKRTGVLKRFAECFRDHRNANSIEHTVEELVAQRVYSLCLGYEDLNDHDRLRTDPMLAVVVGKTDPTGQDRRAERDRGKALAGKSTLNRLELTGEKVSPAERYKKIAMDEAAVDRLFVEHFMDAHEAEPDFIVIDLDATDNPLHGNQEGAYFHGYYDAYCYLPLYIFCGGHLLSVKLRSASLDPAKGALEDLQRVVGQVRERWRNVHILVRGDSGFCREGIMTWCEAEPGIDYVFGLAKNPKLLRLIEKQSKKAAVQHRRTGKMARVFKDFYYKTAKTWRRKRRVVGKAEHLDKGRNPRFVVTSLPRRGFPAAVVYETVYCARGDMENRIKEQQLGLFSDRNSAATMRANQLRMYFSAVGYALMHDLRRLGLKGSEMETAQCPTIRERLLKVGAQIQISVRRVWIRMTSAYPYVGVFQQVVKNVTAVPLRC